MNKGREKAALVLVSAKIPGDLFDELEEIRQDLRIETRSEIIGRALRLYAATVKIAMNGITNDISESLEGKEDEN